MDECKLILERIAVATESIAEAQTFIVASLAKIRESLGAE
jgi:hypothetical protein